MNCHCGSVFRRCLLSLIILITCNLTGLSTLKALSTDDLNITNEKIQTDLTSIQGYTTYAEQLTGLSALAYNISASGFTQFSDSIRTNFFSFYQQTFKNRFKKYDSATIGDLNSILSFPAETLPIPAENIAQFNSDSTILNNIDDPITKTYTIKTDADFDNLLGTIRRILGLAPKLTTLTITDVLQKAFFTTLETLFNNRTSDQAQTTLRDNTRRIEPLKTLLGSVLNIGITQQLLAIENKDNVTNFLNTLSLEQTITAITNEPDMSKQIDALTKIAGDIAASPRSSALPNTIAPITQNIYFTVLNTVIAKRSTTTGDDQLKALLDSGNLSKLFALVTTLRTSLLLNATQQTTLITALTILDVEKAIEGVHKTADYAGKRSALQSIITTSGTRVVNPITQNLFMYVLTQTFNLKPSTDLTELQTLKTLLQTVVGKNITLLTDAQKTVVSGWIVTADATILSLQSYDLMLPPTSNQAAIAALKNQTRLQGLNNILTTQTSLPSNLQLKALQVLQRTFDTRIKSEIPTLQILFSSWKNSNMLKDINDPATNKPASETLQQWLDTLAFNANLPDPSKPPVFDPGTGKFQPDISTPPTYPLDPQTQDQIFALLQAAFNKRDATNLTGEQALLNLLTAWQGKLSDTRPTTPPTQNTLLATWIATIKAEISLLQLATKPAAERIASLDPTTFPTPVPDTLQAKLFAELTKLYNGRAAALSTLTSLQDKITFLTNLKNLLASWIQSGKLTINDPATTKPANQTLQTWNTQLDKEIAGLQIIITPPPTDKPITPGTLDPKNIPDISTQPDLQNQIFAILKGQFDNRNTIIATLTAIADKITTLTNIKTLLASWATSGKLTTTMTQSLQGWVTILDGEIKALQFIQKQPVIDPTKPAILIDPGTGKLNPAILPPDPNLPITPDVQDTMFNILQAAFNQRVKTNATSLQSLLTLLKAWQGKLSSIKPTTPPTQNDALNSWITTTQAELNLLQITTKPADQQITTMDPTQFPTPVADDLQIKILAALKNLFDTRTQTIAKLTTLQAKTDYLTKLKALFQSWKDSGKLTITDTASGKSANDLLQTWITALTTEAGSVSDIIEVEQKMATFPPAGLPYYDATNPCQLSLVTEMLTKALGKTFSTTDQNAFAKIIVTIFTGRTGQSLEALVKLADILKAALTTPLLTTAQQAYVQSMLDTLQVEIASKQIIATTDYESQLNQLIDLIVQYKQIKVIDAKVQAMFLEVLQTVFSKRESQYDPTLGQKGSNNIDRLSFVCVSSQTSSLLNATQQKTAANYADAITYEQIIAQASVTPDYTSKLINVTRVLKLASANIFDSVTNNLFFAVLTQLWNAKDTTNQTTMKQLTDILQTAARSPLLNFTQQQTVRSWLTSVGIAVTLSALDETQLTNVLQKTTTIQDQLNALMAITPQAGKTVTADDQATFASFLQQVINAADTQDPTVAKQVTQAVTQLAKNPLLSSTDSAKIQQLLLPTIQPSATQTIPSATTTTLSSQLDTVLKQSSFKDQLAALQSLVTSTQGQEFSAQDRKLFEAKFNQLVSKQTKTDPTVVSSLTNILANAAATGLISATQQTNIQQQLTTKATTTVSKKASAVVKPATTTTPTTKPTTPTAQPTKPTTTTVTSTTLGGQLDTVIKQSSFMDQLKNLQALITNAQGQNFTDQDRQTFQAKVLQLANKQAKDDPTTFTSIADALDTAVGVGLISDKQRTDLQQQLAIKSAAASELRQQVAADFTEKISTADTSTSFMDKLKALQDLLNFAQGKTFTEDEQKQFSQRLLQTFDARPANDATATKSVVDLATKAQKSSLTSQLPKNTFANIIKAGVQPKATTKPSVAKAAVTVDKAAKAPTTKATTPEDRKKEFRAGAKGVIRESGRKGEQATETTVGAVKGAKGAKAAQTTTSKTAATTK